MNEAAPDLPAQTRLQQLLDRLAPYRHWMAPISFGSGLASFLLIQRSERLAMALALLLLLSWGIMLLESTLTRWKLPRGLLRFLVQAVHQETFFFSLPFFFVTTSWNTPQIFFTGTLAVAGLVTIWDPIYYGVIAARRALFLIFHALSVFVTMLVALPILLHLTTAQSLGLASISIALFSLPGLAQVLDRQRPMQLAALLLGAIVLGMLMWQIRFWVPPATLWVRQAVITDHVDIASKSPGAPLALVTPAQLHAEGLYAYTAIYAPRQLHERVYHRWVLNGEEVNRIPLEIFGGREQGYRAWSHKKGFPADPRGGWRVDVVTEGGQLIGSLSFVVSGDLPVAPGAVEEAPTEPAVDAAPPPMEEPPPAALEPEPAAEPVSPVLSSPESSSP